MAVGGEREREEIDMKAIKEQGKNHASHLPGR